MQVIQLSLWEDLNHAAVTPVAANFLGLLERLEAEILPLSTITEKLDVAGEAILRLGEIYGNRAEAALEEIEYLSHREKEPVLPLNAFDCYLRQSMMVDLGQFIETPELPEVERTPPLNSPLGGEFKGGVSVVRELLVTEALAEIADALQAEVVTEGEWLDIAHTEPIHLWAGRIWVTMVEAGEISLTQLQQRCGLSMVDVWLGLLLGDTGCAMESVGGDFYLNFPL